MRWSRRDWMAACAAAGATPAFAQAPGDTYPLWQIGDGPATVFLFGDCGSAADPWRSERALQALERSAVLWVETPQIGPAEAQVFVQGGADRERPLSSKLSPQQRERVAAAAGKVGATFGDLEPCRPWLAASSLNARSAGRQAPTANPSVVLGRAAVSAGKPIRTEFPDIPSLLAFFQGFSPQAEVEYLMNTVDILLDGDQSWLRRQTAWASGDLSLETQRVLAQMKTYPAGYESGTAVRNRRWVRRLRELVSGGETSFVLVGVTHLVGPAGILDLLDKQDMRARHV